MRKEDKCLIREHLLCKDRYHFERKCRAGFGLFLSIDLKEKTYCKMQNQQGRPT